MTVKQWVRMEDEIEVQIDARDISSALSEALGRATSGRMEERACRRDVLLALNSIAVFLNAFTPELIAMIGAAQRKTIATYFAAAAKRFETDKIEATGETSRYSPQEPDPALGSKEGSE